MSRFTIERADANEITELAHAEVLELGMIHAMLLVEHLGFEPSASDNGVHAWYGWVGLQVSDAGPGMSRPFVLSIDRFGDAHVRIDTRTLGRLFPRALEAVIAEHTTPIIQVQVQVPYANSYL